MLFGVGEDFVELFGVGRSDEYVDWVVIELVEDCVEFLCVFW